MRKFKIVDMEASCGIFLDDIIEAEDEQDAWEQVLNEFEDNIGNYMDIEFEEIFEDEENNNG